MVRFRFDLPGRPAGMAARAHRRPPRRAGPRLARRPRTRVRRGLPGRARARLPGPGALIARGYRRAAARPLKSLSKVRVARAEPWPGKLADGGFCTRGCLVILAD